MIDLFHFGDLRPLGVLFFLLILKLNLHLR